MDSCGVGRLALTLGMALHLAVAAFGQVATAPTAGGRVGKGMPWGYLGDGSGVIDATPPLKVDAGAPVWKAPIPAYGLSSPIVFSGRVFVTCEPDAKCPWPRLLCYDEKDGKELWTAELNHLPATKLGEAQQAEAAKLWGEFWRKYLETQRLRHELRTAPDKKEEIAAKVAALGGVDGDINPNGYWKMNFTEYRKLNDKHSPFKAATLTQDTWSTMGNHGGYVIGESFPTPVSDGKRIYAVTAMGGFFCFEPGGRLVWVKHYPGQAGEYCRNGRSPLVWSDPAKGGAGLIVCDVTAMARGVDCATGEMKWSAPVDAETIITPALIRCASTDIVLCGRGQAFRLPDGAPLKVEGFTDFGATALTKSDERDVVFFTGGGEHGGWTDKGGPKCSNPPPAAVRFALAGDTLKATVLWDGRTVNGKGMSAHTGILYQNGKLYHAGLGIIDAATGKVVAPAAGKGRWPSAVPATGHLLYAANGHIFGVRQESPNREGKGVTQLHYQVCTVDGKVVADTTVPGSNYSVAFALSGDRVYVRTSSHLWCLK